MGRLGPRVAWCGQVLAWVVVLGVAAVLTISVLIPRVGGATPYVILTGSMRPGMPPGTLVVTRPVPTSSIGVGTVVTYQLTSGQPAVVTHRVVRVGFDLGGKPVFQTRGDANPQPDAAWVHSVQIKGVRWYAVPYLGYVTSLVDGAERRVASIAIATGLILYAVAMFVTAAADRLRRRSAVAR